MRPPPHFNSRQYNANNNQLQTNGVNASAPQQVIGNQGNFFPNPMQMRPQFPVGMLNNPQLAMAPFTNPNAYFAPPQFFPFPQGSMQNLNTNNLVQLLAQNALNLPQFLPNGQVGQVNMPNLVQNVNQLLQMQLANSVPQNPGLFVNGQLGMTKGNGVVQQSLDGNGLQHINHNVALTSDFGSPQVQRNQNAFSPGAANSQNNGVAVNGVTNGNNSWRKSHNKNFVGNQKHDASQRGGFGKKQFHHQQNAQGNFRFNNENRGKGNKNAGAMNNFRNSYEQNQGVKKRSLVLNYTVQEIQQWRDERKRNFPSNANIEKKLNANSTKLEATEAEAKIRRQQLKEILAKQAELGCEVAEIPSFYLSDSEQTGGRQQNDKLFGKRGRFHNKYDKGKFNQSDQFSKRQRSANGYANNLRSDSKREPSLLKKLLSSDIKKDKKHLLQVFRFMVTNSFFENWPEKPLKFPLVVVKESGNESEITEEKPEVAKGDASNGVGSITLQNFAVGTGEFDDSSIRDTDVLDKDLATSSRLYALAEDGTGSSPEIGEIMDCSGDSPEIGEIMDGSGNSAEIGEIMD